MLSIEELPKNVSIVGVKIFYGDHKIACCRGSLKEIYTQWNKAYNDNVQIVMIYYNKTDAQGRPLRHNFQGSDFYSFDGQVFNSSNDSRELNGSIKNGKWVSDDQFTKVRDIALTEYSIE